MPWQCDCRVWSCAQSGISAEPWTSHTTCSSVLESQHGHGHPLCVQYMCVTHAPNTCIQHGVQHMHPACASNMRIQCMDPMHASNMCVQDMHPTCASNTFVQQCASHKGSSAGSNMCMQRRAPGVPPAGGPAAKLCSHFDVLICGQWGHCMCAVCKLHPQPFHALISSLAASGGRFLISSHRVTERVNALVRLPDGWCC